jgi:hypothetical protein
VELLISKKGEFINDNAIFIPNGGFFEHKDKTVGKYLCGGVSFVFKEAAIVKKNSIIVYEFSLFTDKELHSWYYLVAKGAVTIQN